MLGHTKNLTMASVSRLILPCAVVLCILLLAFSSVQGKKKASKIPEITNKVRLPTSFLK